MNRNWETRAVEPNGPSVCSWRTTSNSDPRNCNRAVYYGENRNRCPRYSVPIQNRTPVSRRPAMGAVLDEDGVENGISSSGDCNRGPRVAATGTGMNHQGFARILSNSISAKSTAGRIEVNGRVSSSGKRTGYSCELARQLVSSRG